MAGMRAVGVGDAGGSRRREQDMDGKPINERFDVRRVGKKWADAYISQRHYSGSAVWSSHSHFSVEDETGKVWGVLQFGPSMNPKATAKVMEGLEPRGLVELNRMVFEESHPANLVSWAISRAIRLVCQAKPYVEVFQSFADERCGKMGGVYQAANFLFLGSHRTEFYFLDGEWFHRSLLGRGVVDCRGWGSGPKAERLRNGRERAERHEFTQYRYVLPVSKRARESLTARALPYPKPGVVTVSPARSLAVSRPTGPQGVLFS